MEQGTTFVQTLRFLTFLIVQHENKPNVAIERRTIFAQMMFITDLFQGEKWRTKRGLWKSSEIEAAVYLLILILQ
jgi:hypothetical protein